MKIAVLFSGIAALSAPIAAWMLYKPIRVIAPVWAHDVVCVDGKICLDDESKFAEAARLYDDSRHFVEKSIGPFKRSPRAVFCSTPECFEAFGFQSTAGDLGDWGMVIGPRGWIDYYVRHEMIHHRQAEEMGIISQFLRPKWLIEGMAYSLSEDPRRPLSDPWQGYRREFEDWLRKSGKRNFWENAKNIE